MHQKAPFPVSVQVMAHLQTSWFTTSSARPHRNAKLKSGCLYSYIWCGHLCFQPKQHPAPHCYPNLGYAHQLFHGQGAASSHVCLTSQGKLTIKKLMKVERNQLQLHQLQLPIFVAQNLEKQSYFPSVCDFKLFLETLTKTMLNLLNHFIGKAAHKSYY